MARGGRNPTFLLELTSGYAVMGDDQFLPGYSLLLARDHVRELHELSPATREAFLRDMALLGEAVARATSPFKMNYAILGNTEQHLHCHVHARYEHEPEQYRRGPITGYPKELRGPIDQFAIEKDGPLLGSIRGELERLVRAGRS
jgi:diadenosine tetraphosphate (Ap4A) HIT family hydrolase